MTEIRSLHCNTVVIGGGIAALWTAARLKAAGQSVIVLCQGELGSGQTIASQGVIHGGLKYALGGQLTEASESLADMPARWLAALRGEGAVDLRGGKLLSDHQILWTLPKLVSQALGFFGSKALRGRASTLAKSEYPPVFDSPLYRGRLFRIEEPVVDPHSTIHCLAKTLAEETRAITWGENARIEVENGCLHSIFLQEDDGQSTQLLADHWVFAAGAGNAFLLSAIGREQPQMQVRPLHQVIVHKKSLHDFYSVCLGTSSKPPLVATTHLDRNGNTVWYLGGELAEAEGVARSEGEQIEFAQALLHKNMPWVDLSDAEWATWRVNRAEPKTATGARPPGIYCQRLGNVLVTWPSKLALAPHLADEVLAATSGDTPPRPQPRSLQLPHPAVAYSPWDMGS